MINTNSKLLLEDQAISYIRNLEIKVQKQASRLNENDNYKNFLHSILHRLFPDIKFPVNSEDAEIKLKNLNNKISNNYYLECKENNTKLVNAIELLRYENKKLQSNYERLKNTFDDIIHYMPMSEQGNETCIKDYISKLSNQNNNLQDEITFLSSSNKRLEEENREIIMKIGELQENLKDLNLQKGDLDLCVQQKSNIISTLNKKISSLENEFKNEDLIKELEDSKTLNYQLKNVISLSQNNTEILNQEIKSLKEKLSAIENEKNHYYEDSEHNKINLKEQISGLNSKVSSLTKQIHTIQNEKENILQSKDSSMKKLTDEINYWKLKSSSDIKIKDNEIKDLYTSIEEKTTHIRKLEKQIKDESEEKEDMLGKIEEKERKIEEFIRNFNCMDQDITENKKKLSEEKSLNESLKQSNNAKDKQINNLTNEIKNLKSKIEELNSQLEKLNGICMNLKNNLKYIEEFSNKYCTNENNKINSFIQKIENFDSTNKLLISHSKLNFDYEQNNFMDFHKFFSDFTDKLFDDYIELINTLINQSATLEQLKVDNQSLNETIYNINSNFENFMIKYEQIKYHLSITTKDYKNITQEITFNKHEIESLLNELNLIKSNLLNSQENNEHLKQDNLDKEEIIRNLKYTNDYLERFNSMYKNNIKKLANYLISLIKRFKPSATRLVTNMTNIMDNLIVQEQDKALLESKLSTISCDSYNLKDENQELEKCINSEKLNIINLTSDYSDKIKQSKEQLKILENEVLRIINTDSTDMTINNEFFSKSGNESRLSMSNSNNKLKLNQFQNSKMST